MQQVASQPLSQPTILFVSTDRGIGGKTRSLLTLLRFVGMEAFCVVATDATGDFAEVCRRNHLAEIVSTRSTGFRWPTRIAAAFIVTRAAVRLRRSLVAIHANSLSDLSVAAIASRLAGVPCVVWFHSSEVDSPRAARLSRITKRFAHEVRWAAVSETARDLLTVAAHVEVTRIPIVPNPIDSEELGLKGAAQDRVKPVACFVGGNKKVKGFHFLPEVIAATSVELDWKVFTKRPRSVRRDTLEAWTWIDAHPELVQIMGVRHALSDIYSECDVVFVPSEQESFCRVAAESMAAGLPLVASDLPPIRDLVAGTEAAVLFEVGDLPSAADSLLALARSPDLRRRMGDAGKRATLDLRPESVLPSLLEMYGLSLSGRSEQ